MKYWAYFIGKVAVAGGPLYGLLALIAAWFPPRPKNAPALYSLQNGNEAILCNLALMVWFLLCVGAVYLIIWDQRHRCRVCLSRLRMPVETGSWSQMLQLGRPRVEYICPYGHGTLKQDELQISGLETPEWNPRSEDLWEELCAASKEANRRDA